MTKNFYYEPINLGSVKSYFFTGYIDSSTYQVTLETLLQSKEYFCYSSIYFASVLPGKNVRIDNWTIKDPYIFVDQKFYDVRSVGYYYHWYNKTPEQLIQPSLNPPLSSANFPENNIIQERDANSWDVIYYVKKLTSDGSLVIYANNQKYWWGTNAADNGEIKNTEKSDQLELIYNKSVVKTITPIPSSGLSFIKNEFSEYRKNKLYGYLYELRDLEAGNNVALFQHNAWVNWRDKNIQYEYLEDKLPQGVIQVSSLKECASSYKFKEICFAEETQKTVEELENEINNTKYKIKKIVVQKDHFSSCLCDMKIVIYYKNIQSQNVFREIIFPYNSMNLVKEELINDSLLDNELNFSLKVFFSGNSCNQQPIIPSFYGISGNSYIYKFNFCDKIHFIWVYFEMI